MRSANSHLDSHILPQLGKLRLEQVGPENQQVFVNQLAGASRKTVLNILSTLSSMLAIAANWGYASREVELRKLDLPERNAHVPAHFTRSQIESILSLAGEPTGTENWGSDASQPSDMGALLRFLSHQITSYSS